MESRVLEKLFQRNSGCRNVFAGTPFELVSQSTPSSCVCFHVPLLVPESLGKKWYEDALRLMQTHGRQRNTFGLSAEEIPNCWVFNSYEPDKCITWRTDADNMFGALDNETEIFSLSFGPDVVYTINPRTPERLTDA